MLMHRFNSSLSRKRNLINGDFVYSQGSNNTSLQEFTKCPRRKGFDQTITSGTHLNSNLYVAVTDNGRKVPPCNQPKRGKKAAPPCNQPNRDKKLKMISSQAPPMRVRAESKGAMVGVAILRNPYVPYLEDFWGAAQGGKRKFPSHIRGTAVSIPKPSEHNS